MIEKFCGFCDDAFDTLLDAYQMKDWDMTKQEFFQQAVKEFASTFQKWIDNMEDEEEE